MDFGSIGCKMAKNGKVNSKFVFNKKNIALLSVSAFVAVLVMLFLFSSPKIKVKGGDDVTVEVFSSYSDEGADASFFGINLNDRLSGGGDVDTNKTGTYTENYSVKFLWKEKTVTRTVNVIDNTPPQITLKGDPEVTAESIEGFKDPGYTAQDNYDGDITDRVKVTFSDIAPGEDGENIVIATYTVSDSAGNTAKCHRFIRILDRTAPEIKILGSAHMTLKKGDTYNEAGAEAVDNIDGAVDVTVEGKVDTSTVGVYRITYTAVDKTGNKAQAVRVVRVRDAAGGGVPSTSDTEGTAPPAGGSYIYLTFDDGPSSSVTPRLLDILKENDVKATFFILNYSPDKLPIIKRMISEGHTIGIHGYSHDYAKIYRSEEAFMNNFYSLQEKLYNDTGYVTNIARFPGGSSNTKSHSYCPGIMTKLVKRFNDEGLMYVDWNVDSQDATGNGIAADRLYSNSVNGLKKGRSNIILMHDTDEKKTTPDAVKRIIEYGKANGYTFLPLNESSAAAHHGVKN